jgi:hypothetical protein
MTRWGISALCVSALLLQANAAHAGITVEQYQQSYEVLKKVDDVPETERATYMNAHRAELSAATHVQEQAATVWETLLEANDASFDHYGRSLLCNFSEEDRPITFKQLADEYVAELRDGSNLSPSEIIERVHYTDFAEMLVDKMLTHFECPQVMPSGPSAASFLGLPPAPPTPAP